MTNINRSSEVIQNLRKSTKNIESRYPYEYAFGTCWAMLTEEQRDYVITLTEEKAKENN